MDRKVTVYDLTKTKERWEGSSSGYDYRETLNKNSEENNDNKCWIKKQNKQKTKFNLLKTATYIERGIREIIRIITEKTWKITAINWIAHLS